MATAPPLPAAASATTATAALSPQEAFTRQRIRETAKAFEANFLSTALAGMFDGIKPEAPFGGGAGEDAFRSFLNEAMAKQMVRQGGVGLAATVEREMLHMQGLPTLPPALALQSGVAQAMTFQQTTYGRRP